MHLGLSYSIMAVQEILVLLVEVRILVGQRKDAGVIVSVFFAIYPNLSSLPSYTSLFLRF